MDAQKKYFISAHAVLMENLNRISDDLLKVKYYFLATISVISLAYGYIFKYTTAINYPIYTICIVGNIIFWLICEYALSHGFLFRFIQTKIAKIESSFDDELSKDPSSVDKFYAYNEFSLKRRRQSGKYLRLDYIIPDQLIPIYWASVWIIIINTIIAIIFIYYNSMYYLEPAKLPFYPFLLLSFSSLILILKIYNYHIYKINKFLNDICGIRVIRSLLKDRRLLSNSKNQKDFFVLPSFLKYNVFGFIISLLLVIPIAIYNGNYNDIRYLLLFFLVWLFWFPILAIVLHFLKIILPYISWGEKYSPNVTEATINDEQFLILWFHHFFLSEIKTIYYLLIIIT